MNYKIKFSVLENNTEIARFDNYKNAEEFIFVQLNFQSFITKDYSIRKIYTNDDFID